MKGMTDVVCLPLSRINSFERSVTADLLVEMLREAEPEDRARASQRLARLGEIPIVLTRLLLHDVIEVAAPLLEDGSCVSDTDLIDCVRSANIEHRRKVAERRGLSEVVCDAVVEAGEVGVLLVLLANVEARLSPTAVEKIVALSRTYTLLIAGLLRRPELRPSHAFVMFWWAEPEHRQVILQRFAVTREVLQEAASDIFRMATPEDWRDPLVRKALVFIERRQRDRGAVQKSAYASLDEAVADAEEQGMTREIAAEISALAGIKAETGSKIFTDPFGEPLAILCKATGLKRPALLQLWRALRRPETDSEGHRTSALERTVLVYNLMAVDRAQTVLRYWNWSLSSSLTPVLIQAISDSEDEYSDQNVANQRAARVSLSGEYQH
jgi:uncharacterized protein (DUF2336 family)